MTDRNTAPLELLTFLLADQTYGLDITQVREIREWRDATCLPHAPKHIKGVINLRGTVLPVIDLHERLSVPDWRATKRSVVIVTRQADNAVGLLVDGVTDIITLDRSDLQPTPTLSEDDTKNVISALSMVEDMMIRILDLNAVLALKEGHTA